MVAMQFEAELDARLYSNQSLCLLVQSLNTAGDMSLAGVQRMSHCVLHTRSCRSS